MRGGALWGLVGLAVALAAYSFAVRPTAAASEPPQMTIVSPTNVCGSGIPDDWAMVRNGRGLSYWAAPEIWKTMERK